MSTFYDGLKATAHAQLVDKGQLCTFRVVTPGVRNAATATSTPSTADVTVHAVVSDYPQRFIDGTVIITGDKKAVVSAQDLISIPKPGDVFIDAAGIKYAVINAKGTSPGGIVIVWTLQIRK